MKDWGVGQKSEILPFATLFRESYFAAFVVHRGKLVMTPPPPFI